ncbi:MAG: hypothetical protein ACKOPR_09180 [Chakrabartia godavariana]
MDAFVFGFSALGLRTSRFDFFWDLAIMMSFQEREAGAGSRRKEGVPTNLGSWDGAPRQYARGRLAHDRASKHFKDMGAGPCHCKQAMTATASPRHAGKTEQRGGIGLNI